MQVIEEALALGERMLCRCGSGGWHTDLDGSASARQLHFVVVLFYFLFKTIHTNKIIHHTLRDISKTTLTTSLFVANSYYAKVAYL